MNSKNDVMKEWMIATVISNLGGEIKNLFANVSYWFQGVIGYGAHK